MRGLRARRGREWALAAASAVGFFGLAEAGLRLSGYGAEPSLMSPMYVRSATRGYDLKPAYRGEGERSPYLVHPPIAINALGLRGPETALRKPRGVYRILCLGDSYMFGWGVRAEEALPARLETALAAGAPRALAGRLPEALNAGVPAYGTAQELDQLLERGLPLHPDFVLLGYVLNDALPGGDRRPRLAIPFKSALKHSAVYRLLGRLYQAGWLAAMAEASGRGEPAVDILEYERANTETLESAREDVEQARAATVTAIAQMSRSCRRRGVTFLVAILPNRYQIESAAYTTARFGQRLAADLSAADVPSIDLFPAFKEAVPRGPIYLADTHPNAAGHDLAARVVARRMAEILDRPSAAGGMP